MKKGLWKGFLIAAAALTLGAGLAFAGCNAQPDSTDAVSEVYARAVELGYDGTLEEFLAQLRGEDGKDGAPGKDGADGAPGKDGEDGVGIVGAYVDNNGDLIIVLTDGTARNCGTVRGEDGKDGANGEDGAPGKDGVDGEDGKDGADGLPGKDGVDGEDGKDGVDGAPGKDGEDGKDGADGKDGVGISSATVNGEGHLILVLDNGNTVDCGVVTGEAGAQGVGIAQIAFVGEELVVTLSDGTLIHCGRIPACGHVWSAWETALAPTCTCIGCQTRSCSLCGRTEYLFLQAKGHTFGEGCTVIEPACEEAGMSLQVCSACGGVRAQDLPALGHTYENNVCIRCGRLEHGEGLKFMLSGDGTCYRVTGLGTCTDIDLIIPACYNGLPVKDVWHLNSGTSQSQRENLRSVVIPEGVERLMLNPFVHFPNLQQVILPQSLQEIASNTFIDCPKLTSIEIPASVTDIREGAFLYCGGLESITVAEGNPVYHSAGDCIIETATGRVILCTQASVIPSDGSATTIADGAYNANVRDEAYQLVIPSAVTTIEENAFSRRAKLTIYYHGTQAQWESVSGNDTLSTSAGSATICFYSADDPFAAGAAEGNFWHYAKDGVTPVLWSKPEDGAESA